MDKVTQEMIDCWRANYGLDKRSPEDAARWWAGHWNDMAPAGAVAALGLALDEIAALRRDAERLDWISRQHLEELSLQLVVDAKHDGEYYVCGDSNKPGRGPTLRAAIDAAMAEK